MNNIPHDVVNEMPTGCFQGDNSSANLEDSSGVSISIDLSDNESTTMENEHLLPHQNPQNSIHMLDESVGVSANNNNPRNWSFSWTRPEGNARNNILSSFLNTQLRRQRSHTGEGARQSPRRVQQQHSVSGAIGGDQNTNAAPAASQIEIWRSNLNDLLSRPIAPSTQTLRSLITHSGSLRPRTLDITRASDDQFPRELPATSTSTPTTSRLNARLSMGRSISMRETEYINGARPTTSSSGAQISLPNILHEDSEDLSATQLRQSPSNLNSPDLGIDTENTNEATNANGGNVEAVGDGGGAQNNFEDENNVISTMITNFLSHFMRYLPFICLLFVKFIHDHLLELLDLLLLHLTMYYMSKSLRSQVAKLSQKSYYILFRDFALISSIVGYRLFLSSVPPDPLGLLIPPPIILSDANSATLTDGNIQNAHSEDTHMTINFLKQLNYSPQATTGGIEVSPPNSLLVAKRISLGMLIYYVSISDIILKLITILMKITVVMMPVQMVRLKAKARLLVLLEYLSQFYRAFAPIHEWLVFLFESYTGLEIISGFLFSTLYLGAKGFEFADRGKSLKKAIVNVWRNMDTERKPTKSELDAAGSLCPICHDSFNSPIILECGHIFCDDCVGTWFKREQTCPMCRAKVNEDPTWQDGSTTYFCQLC